MSDDNEDDETGLEGEQQYVWIENLLDNVIMIDIRKMKQKRGDDVEWVLSISWWNEEEWKVEERSGVEDEFTFRGNVRVAKVIIC